MKLLTTIAAVLISVSAYSQDLIEYDNGTFSQNGEELSMEQINVLTLLNKAGRGNFRRANRFIRLDKNQNYRITNNIGSFIVGSAAGLFGAALVGVGYDFGEPYALGVGTGLCVVSYKAFSRITTIVMILPRRDKQFNKVADKLNEAIKAANN
ncbi:hypothetical protein OAQ90_01430 [Schleiferiaceae bacterium]|nr:hypothetical protein [Schleiferiaceae bacterium]